MGQHERPVFGGSNSFNNSKQQTTETSLSNNGIIFDHPIVMGTHSFNIATRHQQSPSRFSVFFGRMGGYNVYNILSNDKKMATLVIKLSFILANLFGISLCVYWLAIDFDGIKLFLTSIGVLLYGSMKLYEKYLDIKEKRRKDKSHNSNHK